MPVVIRDFSVETSEQSAPETSAPSQGSQSQPRPQSARQIAQLLKTAQQRACRLHAD